MKTRRPARALLNGAPKFLHKSNGAGLKPFAKNYSY